MLKIKNYKTIFINQVAPFFDETEAESFFYIILENWHHLKRIDLALQPDLEMSNIDLQKWNDIVIELKTQKPIQYILGETFFYDLRFQVDESTLIPRPETEELVALILASNKETNKKIKVLDIGTGSGCIAISLAKNLPNAQVFALDVSQKAIEVAQKNAKFNDVFITFLHQNILETDDLNQQFDIIVSNPPYVRNLEKSEINKNVLDYEPHLALFVEDNDALIFYKKIAQLAKKNLNQNGQLFFEINQYLAKETVELIKDLGFKNIKLHQDIYGNDRMIFCDLV